MFLTAEETGQRLARAVVPRNASASRSHHHVGSRDMDQKQEDKEGG